MRFRKEKLHKNCHSLLLSASVAAYTPIYSLLHDHNRPGAPSIAHLRWVGCKPSPHLHTVLLPGPNRALAVASAFAVASFCCHPERSEGSRRIPPTTTSRIFSTHTSRHHCYCVRSQLLLFPQPKTRHFYRSNLRMYGTLPMTILVSHDESGALTGFIEVGLRSHADGCALRGPSASLKAGSSMNHSGSRELAPR
jgi:hypothetical protein